MTGCSKDAATEEQVSAEPTVADDRPEVVAAIPFESVPMTADFDVDQLLAARLSPEESSAGWIRLFDGQTLVGWQQNGQANFRVEDGSIVVDGGEQSLLCTALPWQDYELIAEFKAGPKTNSGIFLRTPTEPQDPAVDCYEVNIAPDDHPFPTGSLVARLKAESAPEQDFAQWRKMSMLVEGEQITISIDGQVVCDYTVTQPISNGRIGLQHNSGRVEFREVKLRPIGLRSLLDSELSQWTKYPEMPGTFSATEEGWLHVQGGRTQLETKESFDDFVLLAEYKLPTADMNSGIFFRCIPGDEMMGYECQLSNEMVEEDRRKPADHATGGIFKRQEARVVAGEVDQWTTVLLVANGPRMSAWVAGVQVSDWVDTRKANENPRRGLRTEAGTIMIQGHDPGTNAMLKQIKVFPFD
ncbi:MAG: DUF1080 domain-containing protein [Planctomycetota bacterium]